MHGDDRMIVTGSSPQINTALGDVSRPEALGAIQEVAINEKGEVIGTPRPVALASLAPQSQAAPAPVASPAAETEPMLAPLKADAAANKATKPAAMVAKAPVQEPAPSGLFGATFSDLANVFKSSSPSSAEQSKDVAQENNGFYNKLINVIAPTPADAATKPDLPAKVPLPPRRQAALGTNQIQ